MGYAAAEPDYVPAGVPEPTRIYQLEGSAAYFGAARCQVTADDRASAWIACPRRTTLVRRETWALLGLLAGVVPMVVSTAKRPSSSGVPR